MRILIALVAFAAACSGFGGRPQPTPAQVAEWNAVFDSAFHAYDRQDWTGLVRMADPASVAKHRAAILDFHQTMIDIGKVYTGRGTIPMATLRHTYDSLAAIPVETLIINSLHEQMDPYFRTKDLVPVVTRTVLGHVTEGDSLVHITFRSAAVWPPRPNQRPAANDWVNVLTLRRDGARWRPSLNGGLAAPLIRPNELVRASG